MSPQKLFFVITYLLEDEQELLLFSAIFLFQVFTEGNILGTGRNKSQSYYFADTKEESKGDMETIQELATPGGCTAQPLAAPPHGVGPSGAL
jgi:hypothetical protein